MRPPPFPIDVVVPFVDGSTPGFVDRFEADSGKAPAPCQCRSLGELRYTLRSIHTHAPWVRRVFMLVQDEGHIPSWLDREAVGLAFDRDVLSVESRPCYSPHTLFAHASAIPGVGDRFFWWADDIVALRSVRWRAFFTADGRPRPGWSRPMDLTHPTSPTDRFGKRLRNNQDALAQAASLPGDGKGVSVAPIQVPHLPFAVSKEHWCRFVDELGALPAFRATATSRLRDVGTTEEHLALPELWCNWLWRRSTTVLGRASTRAGGALAHVVTALRLARPPWGLYSVRHDPEWTRSEMQRLIATRPAFACLNDEAYYGYDDAEGAHWEAQMELEPNSLAALHEALELLLPAPSPFENDAPRWQSKSRRLPRPG